MYITMQGPWTVQVKSIEDNITERRFVIAGTGTANDGVHSGNAGTSVFVNVSAGRLWTINIQSKQGGVFTNSDAHLGTPAIHSGNIVFDINSNDADSGNDPILDDIILSCSTPNTGNDYVIYGNASCYSSPCYYNPCYPRWLVIETAAQLQLALQNPTLAGVIKQLYPERVPYGPGNPNPPDPFRPMMINLTSTSQAVGRVADIYDIIKTDSAKAKQTVKTSQDSMSTLKHARSVAIPAAANAKSYSYDISALAAIKQGIMRPCVNESLPNLTLNFTDYDRTISELNGGAYTGTGDRDALGSTITDSAGNYIFRFYYPAYEAAFDAIADVAIGENQAIAYRPDIIVSVPAANPPSSVLYESAPYWDIPILYHLNLCFPCSKVTAPSLCFNGNLIGGLGDVELGGNQNVGGSLAAADLDRNSYGNHLHADGTVHVGGSQAGFAAVCSCWGGIIDVKGCMYNMQRNANDPMISYYTIRFKKPGGTWQFVSESYTHPRFSKRNIPGYIGDPVGPIPMNLNVDGIPTNAPAYLNIQKQAYHDGLDWEFTDLDRYMQLNSSIYEAGASGTVYFMVEGYDAAGNLVAGAKDLIALYIDNKGLGFSLDKAWIDADGINVVKAECNLYRIKEDHLGDPIKVLFKANDQYGFLDHYSLSISKCNAAGFTHTESPAGKSSETNPTTVDTMSYVPCAGTADPGEFSNLVSNEIDFYPSTGGNGKWLALTETYTVVYIGLTAQQRITNGYNTGLSSVYATSTSIAIERLP